MFKKAMFAVLTVLIFCGTAHSFDNIGIDIMYMKGVSWNNSWESEYYDYRYTQITVKAENRSWKRWLHIPNSWKLDSEFHLGYHEAHYISTKQKYKNATTFGLGLALRKEVYIARGHLVPYIGGRAGLLGMYPRNDQPDFADSGLLGTFGGFVGIRTPIQDNMSMKFEFNLAHTSDPLNTGDLGRNLDGVAFGVTYYFK